MMSLRSKAVNQYLPRSAATAVAQPAQACSCGSWRTGALAVGPGCAALQGACWHRRRTRSRPAGAQHRGQALQQAGQGMQWLQGCPWRAPQKAAWASQCSKCPASPRRSGARSAALRALQQCADVGGPQAFVARGGIKGRRNGAAGHGRHHVHFGQKVDLRVHRARRSMAASGHVGRTRAAARQRQVDQGLGLPTLPSTAKVARRDEVAAAADAAEAAADAAPAWGSGSLKVASRCEQPPSSGPLHNSARRRARQDKWVMAFPSGGPHGPQRRHALAATSTGHRAP
jgi:hypothetical protein